MEVVRPGFGFSTFSTFLLSAASLGSHLQHVYSYSILLSLPQYSSRSVAPINYSPPPFPVSQHLNKTDTPAPEPFPCSSQHPLKVDAHAYI
jgi:hypothetical protein